jgi:hypothetical protein
MKAAALLVGLASAAGVAGGAPLDIRQLLVKLRTEVKPEPAMEKMRRIHANDRWFTFPKFEQTAKYLEQVMTDAGLKSVEIVAAPADGKSRFGYWTMPLAWDARSAKLEIVSPAVSAELRLLADYSATPASLGMWSGPTPPDGVIAEVVDWKKGVDVRGKLALTSVNPANLKWELVKAGALGAINGFSENPELRDDRQWINAWGDRGWAFNKGDAPLLSFSITPRQAAHLRTLLASGPVRVRAYADTRYYEGVYPYVTGVIPGESSSEEVLTLGHTSEMGAHDNATGVAAMLESLTTINRLIQSNMLPRPRRSIRILAMGELYGSSHYIAKNPDRIRQTIAALCYDTPAASQKLAGTEYTFYLNPHAGSSYVDAFTLRLAEIYFAMVNRPWHEHAYMTGTDTFLGEPMIGVPTTWPYSGTGIRTHHNSADTPETVDSRSMRDLTVFNAAFLYFLAAAGPEEARWLAKVAATRAYHQIVDAAAAPDAGAERIRYVLARQKQAIESVKRVADVDVSTEIRRLESFAREQMQHMPGNDVPRPTDAEAARTVIVRKNFGTIPLDDVSEDERMGYPSAAWALAPITALYWCDGQRSLAEVMRLTRLEIGETKFDFKGFFQFLQKRGYVEFR